MRGLILSAGYGTRLRPYTYFKPKQLVKVGGKPVLELIADHMNKHGIKEIFLNVHHKALAIQKYFGHRFAYIYEPRPTGEERPVEKLLECMPSIRDDYLLVATGDTLTDLDITKMRKQGKGKSIMSTENKVWTGMKILSPTYLNGVDKSVIEWESGCWWVDCGTYQGLKKARAEWKG